MKTRYGWIEIDNVEYNHDIVIHRNRSVHRRSKKQSKKLKTVFGHTPLSSSDLTFLESEKPDIVYIGTGHHNGLPITVDALKILSNYETVIRPTPEILDCLDHELRSFAAVLHVTC
ncbi:MAG TPA: hypothetical protein VMT44_08010 [Methanoregula sp.]|nr:hypothetical protein [Methanoregula sp.]